jgi:ubiquinone/menaquinone biosynthesis C-methylase UbiE
MSKQEQWRVVGNAPELYERHLVPAIFGPWAATLLELILPQAGERVLDVACGTGVVARLVAQYVGPAGEVVGLDLNPGMLAVARSMRPSGMIEWQEGSAVALPFPDAAFDVVFCQQGLQFFPDRPAAVREMYRVLAPGGRLALSVWRPIQQSPGFAALAEALGRHVSPEAAALMHAPFALAHAEELRALIAGAGFGDVVIRPAIKTLRFPSPEEFVQCYLAGSPLSGVVTQMSADAHAALLSDMDAALQSYVDSAGLAFPIEAHLAAAHR